MKYLIAHEGRAITVVAKVNVNRVSPVLSISNPTQHYFKFYHLHPKEKNLFVKKCCLCPS